MWDSVITYCLLFTDANGHPPAVSTAYNTPWYVDILKNTGRD